MPLLTAAAQLDPSGPGVQMIRIGDAVASGMVDSETLGYFLVRTMDFLLWQYIEGQTPLITSHYIVPNTLIYW